MTDSASDSTPRPPSTLSHIIDFLAGLIFVLHLGVTLILGYRLHSAYLNSIKDSYYANTDYLIVWGRNPLPHQILAVLIMLFALNAAWIICRLLAARDPATDPEVLDLHRHRRRRYTWLTLHTIFTGLVQFVTVAMRDIPEMKWDSGSHIRYPLTWLPFAVVLITLLLHLAYVAYVEVFERYSQHYNLNKSKNRFIESDDASPFIEDGHVPAISQVKRKG